MCVSEYRVLQISTIVRREAFFFSNIFSYDNLRVIRTRAFFETLVVFVSENDPSMIIARHELIENTLR